MRIPLNDITQEELGKFLLKVGDPLPNGCQSWTGHHRPLGYGLHWFRGKWVQAHRFAYAATFEDPGELEIDHTCRVKDCINPLHLEAVTGKENLARRKRK